jgi:ATP-dependent Clp protease protease subunit
MGQVKELEENLEECRRLENAVQDFIVSRTRIQKSRLEKTRSHKLDWWFSASEALELGVIDEIKS